MNMHKSQSGFSIVELVLVFVVVGAISFVGYTFLKGTEARRANLPTQATQKATDATAQDIPPAPAIEQTSDLDKASDTLDQIDVDTSADSQQLDAEASNL